MDDTEIIKEQIKDILRDIEALENNYVKEMKILNYELVKLARLLPYGEKFSFFSKYTDSLEKFNLLMLQARSNKIQEKFKNEDDIEIF
jgi:hypothetical protein